MLGVSNISFGLPASAREVVNSVFLYYATKAGLDLAIVNAEKLERFASIPVEERRLAESLLFNTPPPDIHRSGRLARADARAEDRDQSIPHRGDHRAFPQGGEERRRRPPTLPLDQRLANYIIEGTKDGLIADLELKRAGRRGAARHHQRSADGRDDRGRAAVQQQRADRRRSAAIGRGDEGRRRTISNSSWRRPKRRRAARSCWRR